MVVRWSAGHVATLCACAVGVSTALASCGGGSGGKSDGGTRCLSSCDASDTDVSSAPPEGGTSCPPLSDAGEPQVPPDHIAFDGGVPLDQVSYALAVVRCNHFARCFPLAPYVVSECIDSETKTNSWTFPGLCSGHLCVGGTLGSSPFPNAGVFDAAAAGLIRYDSEQESACLDILQAQGCLDPIGDLIDGFPACRGAFTCPADAGMGDGGVPDGAASDAGVGCSADLQSSPPPVPCSSASDCSDAGTPAGPYCVSGTCLPNPCGTLWPSDPAYCASLVNVGQACDSYLSDPDTLRGTGTTSTCSPGLTCKGLAADGGLGVCAIPLDIGGPCTQGAESTGCAAGLICQCGTCELPPSHGPCASGSCEFGVAYCDTSSNTCLPVKQVGAACNAFALEECAPGLGCDSTTNTCQPNQP